jgi:hypothetical protein
MDQPRSGSPIDPRPLRLIFVIAVGVFVGLLLWRGVDFLVAVVQSRSEAAWRRIYDKAKEDWEGTLADRVERQPAYQERLSKVGLLKCQLEEINEIDVSLKAIVKIQREKMRYDIRETPSERALAEIWLFDLKARYEQLLSDVTKKGGASATGMPTAPR